jgi:hypothetical protein
LRHIRLSWLAQRAVRCQGWHESAGLTSVCNAAK